MLKTRDAVAAAWNAITDEPIAGLFGGSKKNAAFAANFTKADKSGFSRRERREHDRMETLRDAIKPTHWM